eukprot:3649224-Prymnesium_polylepis.1
MEADAAIGWGHKRENGTRAQGAPWPRKGAGRGKSERVGLTRHVSPPHLSPTPPRPAPPRHPPPPVQPHSPANCRQRAAPTSPCSRK